MARLSAAKIEIAYLKRRLSECEAAQSAMTSGQVDAGIDKPMSTPDLLHETQKSLMVSEARLRALVENTSAALFIIDGQRICYASPAAAIITGYTSDEMLSMEFWQLVHPAFQQVLKDILSGRPALEYAPVRYELRLLTKHSEERWVDITSGPIEYEGHPAWVMTAFDITDRDRTGKALKDTRNTMKVRVAERTAEQALVNQALQIEIAERMRIEETLRENEHRLQQAQELLEAVTKGTEVIIAAVDTGFCYTFFNKAYQEEIKRLSGRDIQVGASMLETFADLPEQQKTLAAEWSPVLGGESTSRTLEFGDPGRYRRIYHMLHTPIRNTAGEVIGGGEVAYDITQTVRTQQALRESEERFRLVLKHAPVTVAAQDKDLRFIWAYNQRTVNPADVIGKTDADIFPLEYAARLTALKRQVLATGTEVSEQLWVTSGGQRVFLDLFLVPIRDQAGEITGVGIATVDFTKLKLAEQALRESEERFQLFMNNSPTIAWIKDEQGRHVYHSKTCQDRFGERLKEWQGKTDFDIWPQEIAERFEQNDHAVWESGKPSEVSEETPNLDGSQCTWWTFRFPFQNTAGQRFIGGIGVDITDLRKTQKQLQKSHDELDMRVQERTEELARTNDELRAEIAERHRFEEQLRLQTSALEAAANGIIITEKSGNILWANPAFTKMTGYSFDEIYRQNPRFLKSGHHDEAYYATLWSTILSGQVWHGGIVNRRKDGSLYYEDMTITPVVNGNGKISHFIAIKQDITDHRRAEQELEKSEERYRSLVIATAQMVWTTNADGEVVDDLPAWRAFTGQSEREINGRGWLNALHPEDRQRVASVWAQSVETRTIYDIEYRVRRHDGEYRYLAVRGVPVLEKDNRIREWVGTCHDITERIRADRELERASAYHRSLIEASLDPLVTIMQNGKIGDVNSSTETITGFSRAELIGTDFHSYFTEADKARAGYQQVFEKGSVRDYALEIQHKDGTSTPVLYNASLYRDESGEVIGVFASARDITARKRAEALLEKQNRELLALSQVEHKQQQLAETLRLTSLALTQSLNVDTVMDTLLEYMGKLIPYDSASVALLGGDALLSIRAVRIDKRWEGIVQENATIAEASIPPQIITMLSKPQSVLLSDLHEPPIWSPLPGNEHIHSWLGVPLVTEGKFFGLCSLGKSEPGFFSQEHVQLAETFVAQASVAVQNAWLFEQVRAGRERLQALSHRLVEIQETERRAIARELHDEAGQALASLIVGLRLLEQEAHNPEATKTRVVELRGITDNVMEELHRLAMDLRPASLDQLGLVAALKQFIDTLSDRQAMDIQFEAIGFESGRLSPAVETPLYRIVQEALTNAVLHSRATEIAVILDRRGDRVIVIVEDNGVGFEPEAEINRGRMGLAGMRERAEMLGGTLTLESEVGSGTTVHVEVPYGDTNTRGR